ncbi:Uncharacterized protein TCAP_01486 [Tolypocladium capitatum]|uniref:Uncharacterized protein n=1 Tax=Tolypocladium capitatum TaxID=45235 RepID=A0A2K3QM24_9HYPO|nr:Uncharacterized protein TCAP_01486 [Tolypocladium capitatum]
MRVQGAGGQLQSPSAPGGASPRLPQGPLPQGPLPQGSSTTTATPQPGRKRKAEPHDNERLSKRLGLLNLEPHGSKLHSLRVGTPAPSPDPTGPIQPSNPSNLPRDDSMQMQLDDSKHKVYVYNIDDELSSDSEGEEGSLVFPPYIDKHLKENRIPPHILANSEGELAGMQMVLYSDPKSLTVPEGRDSVRKAIIEARHRVRERQRRERDGTAPRDNTSTTTSKMSQTQVMEPQDDDDGDVMDMD